MIIALSLSRIPTKVCLPWTWHITRTSRTFDCSANSLHMRLSWFWTWRPPALQTNVFLKNSETLLNGGHMTSCIHYPPVRPHFYLDLTARSAVSLCWITGLQWWMLLPTVVHRAIVLCSWFSYHNFSIVNHNTGSSFQISFHCSFFNPVSYRPQKATASIEIGHLFKQNNIEETLS